MCTSMILVYENSRKNRTLNENVEMDDGNKEEAWDIRTEECRDG